MGFEIWKSITKFLPVVGLLGFVLILLGNFGDPKVIINKKKWKRWGLILIGLTVLLLVTNTIVIYILLSNR